LFTFLSSPIGTFLTLAALWGSSFSFMRIAAPALGTYGTSLARAGLGALLLFTFSWRESRKKNTPTQATQVQPQAKIATRHYVVVGILNSALPFLLFNTAATQLPSNISAVLNSSTPLFGFVLSILFLKEAFSWKAFCGVLLGILGVIVVKGVGASSQYPLLPIVLCLIATFCYACAGIYSRLFLSQASAKDIAAYSLLYASLILLPLAIWFDFPHLVWSQVFQPQVIISVLGLAGLCSALAYFLYFRLLNLWGPTKTATVTFVIPLFGVVWAYFLLGEIPTHHVLAGGVLVILGTTLILKKN
jgi:drug/metabolite transporter (DMT)-like permease